MWDGPLLTTTATGAVWLHLSYLSYLRRGRRASTDQNLIFRLDLFIFDWFSLDSVSPASMCESLIPLFCVAEISAAVSPPSPPQCDAAFSASSPAWLTTEIPRLYQALSKQLTLAVLIRRLAFLCSSNLISSPIFRLPNHRSPLSRIYPAIPSSLTRSKT